MHAYISVLPHCSARALVGLYWGTDTKLLAHYGHLTKDKSVSNTSHVNPNCTTGDNVDCIGGGISNPM